MNTRQVIASLIEQADIFDQSEQYDAAADLMRAAERLASLSDTLNGFGSGGNTSSDALYDPSVNPSVFHSSDPNDVHEVLQYLNSTQPQSLQGLTVGDVQTIIDRFSKSRQNSDTDHVSRLEGDPSAAPAPYTNTDPQTDMDINGTNVQQMMNNMRNEQENGNVQSQPRDIISSIPRRERLVLLPDGRTVKAQAGVFEVPRGRELRNPVPMDSVLNYIPKAEHYENGMSVCDCGSKIKLEGPRNTCHHCGRSYDIHGDPFVYAFAQQKYDEFCRKAARQQRTPPR